MTGKTIMTSVEIRESTGADQGAIDTLYPRVFPGEDLRALVRSLERNTPGVLSLVAVAESGLVGHAVFTSCDVAGGPYAVALLGPLAVAPEWQRRGIGSALVRSGFERLRASGFDRVFVLGDPGYYRRFGFEAESSVTPPHPFPDEWREAWQSVKLHGAAPHLEGKLGVPPAWDAPMYWSG
jgi:putative acetyltransferase